MKHKSRYLRLFTIEFLVAGILCLLSILLFMFIADEIIVEQEDFFDRKAFAAMDLFTSSFLTNIALVITFLGTGYFLIPAYLLIIIYFLKLHKTNNAMLVAVIAIVSMLSGWALKQIFHRYRPVHPLISGAGGYSFPSGHALGGFTFSGLIIYLAWQSKLSKFKKWLISISAFLLGLLIGLSRIYLHVHFASDVLGSFFVTIIWLSLSFIFLQFYKKGQVNQ